mmetsp:Transcript_3021/g.4312  ORF Transcript_3021/g.4312 Transcript_3021/m.4312 type:complete len:84 (+) Transcript_3021:2784-3035(+)
MVEACARFVEELDRVRPGDTCWGKGFNDQERISPRTSYIRRTHVAETVVDVHSHLRDLSTLLFKKIPISILLIPRVPRMDRGN